jgi:hypothetical protein
LISVEEAFVFYGVCGIYADMAFGGGIVVKNDLAVIGECEIAV